MKCAANHIRHAQQEELIPWDRLMTQEAEESAIPPPAEGSAAARSKYKYYDMTSEQPDAKRQRPSTGVPVGPARAHGANAEPGAQPPDYGYNNTGCEG